MKKLAVLVAVMILVFTVFYVSFFSSKSKAKDNYVILSAVESTTDPGIQMISIILKCETIPASIKYTPKLSFPGYSTEISIPKGGSCETKVGLGDLSGKHTPTSDLMLCKMDQKVSFSVGEKIPLFRSITPEGKECVAELIAR